MTPPRTRVLAIAAMMLAACGKTEYREVTDDFGCRWMLHVEHDRIEYGKVYADASATAVLDGAGRQICKPKVSP